MFVLSMRYNIWIWVCLQLYVLLTVFPLESQQLSCVHSEHCGCLQEYQGLELTCPPQENVNVSVHISRIKKTDEWMLKIDCWNHEDFVDILPNINVPNITYFRLQSCALPSDGFSTISRKFNITNLEYLKYELGYITTPSLSENYLAGLESVTALILSSNGFRKIDGDVFKNFPKLESLDLRENNLSLADDLFKYATTLVLLDITDNNIQHIPDGVFVTLNKLELLDMWRNEITNLTKTSFLGLDNLLALELSYNKLRNIDEDALLPMKNLVNISLNANQLQSLPENVFKNNKLLKHVRLDSNMLQEIPENLFAGCNELRSIDLSYNNLTIIPDNLFNDLQSLQILHLQGNELHSASDLVFRSLTNLTILNLQDNKLTRISDNMFSRLWEVKEIYLDRNRLTEIGIGAFQATKQLQKITLASNNYNIEETITPFGGLADLRVLDLSHNRISDMNFVEFKVGMQKLEVVNLTYNFFTEIEIHEFIPLDSTAPVMLIDLAYNNISTVSFSPHLSLMIPEESLSSITKLNISYNQFACDCELYDLVKYFNREYGKLNSLVHIDTEDFTCMDRDSKEIMPIAKIPIEEVICPLRDIFSDINNCSGICECLWRPNDRAIIINCANKSLSHLPELSLPPKEEYENVVIDLTYNSLKAFTKRPDYDGIAITKLMLSHNAIQELNWIPPNVSVLNIDHNNLEHMDDYVLEVLNSSISLKNFTLQSNPWICDCQAKNLTDFLRLHSKKVHPTNVLCQKTHKALINLTEKTLCQEDSLPLMLSMIIIMFTLLVFVTLAALYYIYSNEIKVWLYAKHLCLWLVTEEDLDKDKEFDAFISYSHKDEQLIENFVEILENGPRPYKLCLHYRDWIPGEYVTSQIVRSVQNSKRTIIILSNNFIDSVWAKMEFQAAHIQAMEEKRAKVIIVLYGDVDMEKIDGDLKMYLKINTYLKWGDPWFWNKLRYALPHGKQKSHINAQKHANMMMTIENKFAITQQPTTGKQEDVQQVRPLDAESLMKHPLNLISIEHPQENDIP